VIDFFLGHLVSAANANELFVRHALRALATADVVSARFYWHLTARRLIEKQRLTHIRTATATVI